MRAFVNIMRPFFAAKKAMARGELLVVRPRPGEQQTTAGVNPLAATIRIVMRVGPLLALLADVKLPMSQPTVSLLAAAADGAGPLKDETPADPFLPAWRELLGDELAASEGKTTWNKMSYVLDLTAEAFTLLAP